MLSKGEKIFTLITNLLTFTLCLLVVVPFGKTAITEKELLFKVLIAPIAMLVLFLFNSYIKYINPAPTTPSTAKRAIKEDSSL